MFAKIKDNIIVSFSNQKMEWWLYTEQKYIHGGMIVLSSEIVWQKDVILWKKKVLKMVDVENDEWEIIQKEEIQIKNIVENLDVYTFDLTEDPEYIKIKDIAEYREIEKKSVKLRSEYLTAEMMPESLLKEKKLAKLIIQWEDATIEFNKCVTGLITKHWESILDELI